MSSYEGIKRTQLDADLKGKETCSCCSKRLDDVVFVSDTIFVCCSRECWENTNKYVSDCRFDAKWG